MNNTKKILVLIPALMLLFDMPGHAAKAQDINKPNFTVQAVIPDNQIDKKQTFFDLRMKPGESQTLSINVTNTGNEDLTIEVAVRAASTNRNGLIEYQVETPPDESLKIPLNTIVKTGPQVVVPAKGTKTVDLDVAMPAEQFDGIILGGIIFTSREPEGPANSGMSITNRFSYVIGVQLSETDKVIVPNIKLKSIEPTLINYRKAVVANIQNPDPAIVRFTRFSASVYAQNDKKPLFTIDNNNISMAPNSVFPLPIEWEGKSLEAGEYRLELTASYADKDIEWNENFAISDTQARNINNSAISTASNASARAETNNWFIPAVVAGVLLLLVLAFILGRRQSKDKTTE